MSIEKQMVDFYNGAHMLEMVAGWAYAVANNKAVVDHVASFEKSYEELIELHTIGKLGVGGADFSVENLELVKRINRLIQPGLESSEARLAAQEIHDLAERCLRGLKRSE